MRRPSSLVRIARALAGLGAFALAGWLTFRAWRTRPLYDPAYGLRLTPLAARERSAALELEQELAATATVRV